MTTDQPTPILDDPIRIFEIDKRNMLRLINELPEQCETALGLGRSFAVEPTAERPTVVYITGVGDSGTAADMAVAVTSDEIDIPVVSDHGGRLPRYVGENALVFVVDYLGKSQASIRNYREARARGANVVCVTSGGKLSEAASKDGARIVKIPPGQPPRTAIGYLFVPLVAVMESYGLVSGVVERVSFGIKLMKNVRETIRFDSPTARNVAKQTAEALAGKIAVIYGAAGYRSVVAQRWKTQINANSKAQAFTGVFPDAAEGEISGWERRQCENLALVFLKDSQDKTEVADMMSASLEILSDYSTIEIDIKGGSTAERLLYGVYLADYVSCYLALLDEVNPSLTGYVADLESRLAGEEPEE